MSRIILILSFAIWAQFAVAQNFYGSQQFGGEATFMGGTAVVGSDDNSCFYYNPGGLGFVDSAKITASTYLYGLESIILKNGYGNGVNLTDLHLFVFPQMLIFDIHFRKVPRLKLVLGTFTRYRTDWNITEANQNNYSVITSQPGTQFYSANVQYVNNSVEQWTGFGLAYRFSKIISVGFSYYVSYTNINESATQNSNLDATASGTPYTASVNEFNSLIINQFSQIFKLGMEVKLEHLQMGFSITPPDIETWGQGTLTKNFGAYNLNQNATDTTQLAYRNSSFVISDVQDRLRSYYLQPLSASAGVQWVQPNFRIAASLEFFAGFKNRTIVAGVNRDVIHPPGVYGNDTVNGFMTVQTSAIPVVNVGIGGMYKLKPKVDFMFGMQTDINNKANYLPNNSVLGIVSAVTPIWNYLDFSSGINYKLNLNQVTIGAVYGVGIPDNHRQIFDLTDPQQYTYLRGPLENTMHTYVNRISLVFSWTYFFKIVTSTYPPIPFFDTQHPIKKKTKKQKKTPPPAIIIPERG